MDVKISGTWSLTPADKRVYAWKFFHTLLSVAVFIIAYHTTGDYEKAVVFAGAVAVIGTVVFTGAFTFAFAVAVAVVFTGVFTFAVAVIGTVAGIFAVVVIGTVAGIFAVAVASAEKEKEKYKISISSNLASAGIQFLLMWVLFHLATHLRIATV